MSPIGSGNLLQSIEREASLFESEADLRAFLQRAAAAVIEGGIAAGCGIYVAGRRGGAPALWALAGSAEGLPRLAAEDDPVAAALRTRSSAKRPAACGLTRHFLPITRGPDSLGILVLDVKGDLGTAAEEDFRGLASRLGSVLENATILLETRAEQASARAERIVVGDTASAGIARGRALLLDAASGMNAAPGPEEEGEGGGITRFNRALEQTRSQIEGLLGDPTSQLADVVELIFSAHLMMLNDDAFTGAMRRLVEGGRSPEAAVREVVAHYAGIFDAMSETRLAEKAHDVRDLGHRLLRNLAGNDREEGDYRGRVVLAAHVYPSDLVRLAAQRAEGVVLLGGAATAHVTILARSLSLPVLIAHDRSILEIPPGTELLLDAGRGRLHVNPRPAAVAAVQQVPPPAAAAARRATVTADGTRVRVLANVNLYKDVQLAAAQGADGIGLYRSEFLFIIRSDFLSEREQYATYRRIVDALPDREVCLRTADIGGDKLMQGRGEQESNPFLGVRGIRFSLANRVLFREQLRAMLRAGAGRDLGILLPMVSSLEEVEETRGEVEVCLRELAAEGLEHNPRPRIGAMVELPSAVMAVEDLAAATDFLSIGTNDLIMYLLAVDRTNERLSRLYRSHHPTVLRSLAQVARGMGSRIGELSVCGDSAADPLMIPFLLGIGVRKLSVAPQRLAEVRAIVGRLGLDECEAAAREMLAIRTIRDMDAYLHGLRARLEIGAA